MPFFQPNENIHEFVFRYGPRAFPDQTFAATNYWVDVVFRSAARRLDQGPTPVAGHPLP